MPGEIVYDDGEFFIQQASPREYVLLRRVPEQFPRQESQVVYGKFPSLEAAREELMGYTRTLDGWEEKVRH